MPVATNDVNIRPEDGWVLVATNPTFLNIRPSNFSPWFVAVTDAGAPADGLQGQQFGRGTNNKRECFILPVGITGLVYIRVKDPIASEPVNQKTHFGVIVSTA